MADVPASPASLREMLAAVADPIALLEGLFTSSPVAYQVYRADGHSVLVNQAFREMFGAEPPPEYNVLRDEIAERNGVLGLIHRAFAGETVHVPAVWYDPRELTQVDVKVGNRVAIEATFFPLFGAGNVVSHVGIAFTDVSAEMLARENAERDAARAAFLVEASETLFASLDYAVTLAGVARLAVPRIADSAGVYEVGPEGSIHQLAAAHVDPAKEPLLWEFHRLLPLHMDQQRLLQQALRTGKSQLAAEIPDAVLDAWTASPRAAEIMRALRPRSHMVVPLRTRERVIGAIALLSCESNRRFTAQDVALAEELARRAVLAIENARLYRDAQAATRLRDEFLATVSHELRTPLTAILGWVSLLRTGKNDPERVDRAIATIERNARAQARLVDDVLDVSRIIAGKLRLDLESVDIAAVMQAAGEAIRPAAEAKGVALSIDVDPAVGALIGDAGRLQQIAWNLASNGVKFTPRGGSVELNARRDGTDVLITAHDSGIGIDREFLPRVFERFSQADSSTTRAHAGLGLGLAITRHLVELHGGTIAVVSPGTGGGTTFTVRLPARTTGPSAMTRSPDEAMPSASVGPSMELRDVKVLVVDDDDDGREMIAEGMRGCGARVQSADGAAAALDALALFVPDVIISDIGMPRIDGYTLMRTIRELPASRGGRIPGVALTARAREQDARDAFDAGYQRHVSKPVDLAELVAIVANLAGRTAPPKHDAG